jgi:hypothetical protein
VENLLAGAKLTQRDGLVRLIQRFEVLCVHGG